MKFEEKLALDSSGRLSLVDTTFENEIFEQFAIRPPVGTTAMLRDVTLIGCKITPGTCVIREDAILRDVLFNDFECGDAMRISSEVVLERVVIKGSRLPKRLEIKPNKSDYTPSSHYENVDFALDVSEFFGEVSVIGIPVEKIKTDPERQVKIECGRFESADLKALGIGGLSYWKLIAKKIVSTGARQGVFDIPGKVSGIMKKR